MRIFIHAKPNANEERVEQVDETHFMIAVKEPPIEGRANAAIERALAGHFNVPVSSVRIVSGRTSREKVVEVVIA